MSKKREMIADCARKYYEMDTRGHDRFLTKAMKRALLARAIFDVMIEWGGEVTDYLAVLDELEKSLGLKSN